MSKSILHVWVVFLLLLVCVPVALGQATAFTYQGELNESGVNADGSYDFEFRLFDAVSGGIQKGTTAVVNAVNVSDGVFSVVLDFGNQYAESNRFLDIKVRPAGGGQYTLLSPRQAITSTPYAVNALTLGGINSDGFIHNSTSYQEGANITINGTITTEAILANTIHGAQVNATTFTIAGDRIVSTSGTNLYLGLVTRPDLSPFDPFGDNNTFVGQFAGDSWISGDNNTYLGAKAGHINTLGSSNSAFGAEADFGADNLTRATAIGAGSIVSTNNTVMLGTPTEKVIAPGTMIVGNKTALRGTMNIYANSSNANLYMQAAAGNKGINVGVSGSVADEVSFFIAHYDGTTYTDRLTITPTGEVRINVLGSAGNTALCRNASNQIATCSSSLRYKTNVADYNSGLSLIDQLHPVSFNWKTDNTPDIGFIAEEVSELEPLLVTTNEDGQIEGVKYDSISAVLVKAMQEQQTQIETLQDQVTLLTQLLCVSHAKADICK